MIDIKVLGTGCSKCNKLYEETKKAVDQSGAKVTISKVEKIDEIAEYGIMMTPALVVNGEVKSTGKIPKLSQMVSWILEAKDN